MQRFERGAPNELWQMDFKSPKGWNAPIGPLSVLDDHSRTLAPSGATELTIWLMKQGIELHWSGRRHPQTQGKVERFHGELERALQLRGAPRKEPQSWLDAFRW